MFFLFFRKSRNKTYRAVCLQCVQAFFPVVLSGLCCLPSSRSVDSSSCETDNSTTAYAIQDVISAINCTFQNGLCAYRSTGRIDWTMKTGYIEARYLNIEGSARAVLQSPCIQLPAGDSWCLRGNIKSEIILNFLINFNGTRTMPLNLVNAITSGQEFNRFAVTVPADSTATGTLDLSVIMNSSTAYAQLRSITIEEGSCDGSENCSSRFTEKCQWKSTNSSLCTSDTGNRNKSRNTLSPLEDHSTTGDHQYFWMNLEELEPGESCSLESDLSRAMDGGEVGCLKFWYYMDGEGNDSLSVSLVSSHSSTNNEQITWTKIASDAAVGVWNEGLLRVKSTSPYKIQFKGTRGVGNYSSIALDDIEFSLYASDCGDKMSDGSSDTSHSGVQNGVMIAVLVAAVVIICVGIIAFFVYKTRKERLLAQLRHLSSSGLEDPNTESSNPPGNVYVVSSNGNSYEATGVDLSPEEAHTYCTIQEATHLQSPSTDLIRNVTATRRQNAATNPPPATTSSPPHLNRCDEHIVAAAEVEADALGLQTGDGDVDGGYLVAKPIESSDYDHLFDKPQEAVSTQQESDKDAVKQTKSDTPMTRLSATDLKVVGARAVCSSLEKGSTNDKGYDLASELENENADNEQQWTGSQTRLVKPSDSPTYNHLSRENFKEGKKGASEKPGFQNKNTKPASGVTVSDLNASFSDISLDSEACEGDSPYFLLEAEATTKDGCESVNEILDDVQLLNFRF